MTRSGLAGFCTKLQHIWAEIYERLGDKWGRGIRYDKDPEHSDPDLAKERVGLVRLIRSISTQNVAKVEKLIDGQANKYLPNRLCNRRVLLGTPASRRPGSISAIACLAC